MPEIQQLQAIIQEQERRINLLEKTLFSFVRSDNFYFSKHIILADGAKIKFNTGTGNYICDAAAQKISFFGKVPVVQPTGVSTVTETGTAEDGNARTAINAVITRLRNLGLISS